MNTINHKSFVLAWVEAYNKKQGVQAVANKLEVSVSNASAKANYLRRQGVNLPAMPRKRSYGYSVEELNELIATRV